MSMMVGMIDLHRIRRWYTGKALAAVDQEAIPALRAAEAQGFWQKRAAKRVKALLNKQAVAIRFARANERDRNKREDDPSGMLDDICDTRPHWYRAKIRGGDILHAMQFGIVDRASALRGLAGKLMPFCVNDDERAALATAAGWVDDFAPVADLVAQLDATRPRPVFVIGEVSPTVFANVCDAMGLDLTGLEIPEVEWRKYEYENDGRKMIGWIGEILWPEGTRHNASRFSSGSRAGNDQCQACGHAIKRQDNWVPLVARSRDGEPLSLWVGMDCANNLFSVKVENNGMFSREPAKLGR